MDTTPTNLNQRIINNMSELMIMQQDYMDWLNQSKFYQFLPFIILSSLVLLIVTAFTKITPSAVMLITYNPLSLLVYFALGVVPFITVPAILFFGFIYWVIISIRKLNIENKEL